MTITKAITIHGTDGYASIANGGTNGIVINAPGDADVILRGLDIIGGTSGGVAGTCGGVSGVSVLAARSVRLDNIRITGQASAIQTPLTNSSTDIFVDIAMSDLELAHNCSHGILLQPAAGHQARVSLTDSFVTQSNIALLAGSGTETWASQTHLNLNNTGVQLAGGIVHAGCGTEAIGNATDGTFTDNTCPGAIPLVVPAVKSCRSPGWSDAPSLRRRRG